MEHNKAAADRVAKLKADAAKNTAKTEAKPAHKPEHKAPQTDAPVVNGKVEFPAAKSVAEKVAALKAENDAADAKVREVHAETDAARVKKEKENEAAKEKSRLLIAKEIEREESRKRREEKAKQTAAANEIKREEKRIAVQQKREAAAKERQEKREIDAEANQKVRAEKARVKAEAKAISAAEKAEKKAAAKVENKAVREAAKIAAKAERVAALAEAKAKRKVISDGVKSAMENARREKTSAGRRPKATHIRLTGTGVTTLQRSSLRGGVFERINELHKPGDTVSIELLGEQCKDRLYGLNVRQFLAKLEEGLHLEFVNVKAEKEAEKEFVAETKPE